MDLPRDRLTIRFSRSGGPGGQNVNKVETRVEVRFALDAADWIPTPVRARLRRLAAERINREGELIITSSRHRSQSRNIEDCLEKLKELIQAASRRPRKRIPTKPTGGARERRLEGKKQRGDTKRGRSWRPE
ncbi:MAG TPA: alternative ribosome rescue aminoacyl-tRNA hydrolase ArfB [Planctomycetota bacterium]|nr:alternative ribosome rescue aminoacyl-tRNA hydrolase ArfB [Planctomycetota bacterium]